MINGVLMILVRFSLLATLHFLMIALLVFFDFLEFLWFVFGFCSLKLQKYARRTCRSYLRKRYESR